MRKVEQTVVDLLLQISTNPGLFPRCVSRVTLVESIPEGLAYQSSSPTQQSIADRWLQLLDEAEGSVDIAAFYFTLRSSDTDTEASTDQQVSSALLSLQA